MYTSISPLNAREALSSVHGALGEGAPFSCPHSYRDTRSDQPRMLDPDSSRSCAVLIRSHHPRRQPLPPPSLMPQVCASHSEFTFERNGRSNGEQAGVTTHRTLTAARVTYARSYEYTSTSSSSRFLRLYLYVLPVSFLRVSVCVYVYVCVCVCTYIHMIIFLFFFFLRYKCVYSADVAGAGRDAYETRANDARR